MEYLRGGLQHQVKQVAREGVPGGGGVVAQAEQVEEPGIKNEYIKDFSHTLVDFIIFQ